MAATIFFWSENIPLKDAAPLQHEYKQAHIQPTSFLPIVVHTFLSILSKTAESAQHKTSVYSFKKNKKQKRASK